MKSSTKKGGDFLGAKYEPIFPYFASLEKCKDGSDGAFRIFNADYVSTEDGTGIVHTAPAFGEDDSKVFKKANEGKSEDGQIPFVEPIDAECNSRKKSQIS